MSFRKTFSIGIKVSSIAFCLEILTPAHAFILSPAGFAGSSVILADGPVLVSMEKVTFSCGCDVGGDVEIVIDDEAFEDADAEPGTFASIECDEVGGSEGSTGEESAASTSVSISIWSSSGPR